MQIHKIVSNNTNRTVYGIDENGAPVTQEFPITASDQEILDWSTAIKPKIVAEQEITPEQEVEQGQEYDETAPSENEEPVKENPKAKTKK